MTLIARAKSGHPLPASLPHELVASAAGAPPQGGGSFDDFDDFSDFAGAQAPAHNTDFGARDDDFGDFEQFQEPSKLSLAPQPAKSRPPPMSMDLLGAPVFSPPATLQAQGSSALDDLFGGSSASASVAGDRVGGIQGGLDAFVSGLGGEPKSSAPAMAASPAAKAAQFVDLFSESLKPKPKMRDMPSPSAATVPVTPLWANSSPTTVVPAVSSSGLGQSVGSAPPPTATIADSAEKASLVFDVFTELAQKDGIISQSAEGAVEEGFGDFVSDASFAAAGPSGESLQMYGAAADFSSGPGGDDFGGDFGAFESADSGVVAAASEGLGVGVAKPPDLGKVLAVADIQKGGMYWYRDGRDGVEKQVEVVSIDRSIDPPSFGIRVDGRERETEGHRLYLRPSQQMHLSAHAVSSLAAGAGMGAEDADWGAFETCFGGSGDFGAGFEGQAAGAGAELIGNESLGWGGGEAVVRVEEMTTAVAEVTENLIGELVDMGFARDRAEAALMKSGLDLEGAATWLLGEDEANSSPPTTQGLGGLDAKNADAPPPASSKQTNIWGDLVGGVSAGGHVGGWQPPAPIVGHGVGGAVDVPGVAPLTMAQTDSDDDFGDFTEYKDGGAQPVATRPGEGGELAVQGATAAVSGGGFDLGAGFGGADDDDFGAFDGGSGDPFGDKRSGRDRAAGNHVFGGGWGATKASSVADAFADLLVEDGIIGAQIVYMCVYAPCCVL